MYKYILPLPIFFCLSALGWGYIVFGTTRGYSEYISGWEYRRLHPELIPPSEIVKMFDVGHTSSYASFMWLSLIQYIGDNVGGNRFLSFSHTILSQIASLHPYFTRPYEIDLILAPISAGENMTPEQVAKNKNSIANSIDLGERGMSTLCDSTKINIIKNRAISESLWNDVSLQDPCPSGMLPYYLAFTLHQTGDNKSRASTYYKIASMNHDAPRASRILSLLALSADGDYLASATNLALIGSTGFDTDPYACRAIATSLVRDLIKKRKTDQDWINELMNTEKGLIDTRDIKNPLASSSDNCYDMTTRSIKYIYLDYIASIAKSTTAKTGSDLIKIGKIQSIPTLTSQSGYDVRIKNGVWEYQAK